MNYLPACLSLALGEALGLLFESFASAWPAAAALSVAAAFISRGLGLVRGRLAVVFLLGLTLALASRDGAGDGGRLRFWRRDRGTAASFRAAGVPRRPLSGLRGDLSRRLGIGLAHDGEAAALNRAILLGERGRIPRRTKRLFVDAGTVHVFAISGLHVMIVARLFQVLVLALCVPVRLAGLVALPILWCYVVMIGGAPSAVRAAMMASFSYAAPVFFRRADGLAAWSLTFLSVHLANPEGLFDTGSALSFAVMLGILLWLRYARRMGLSGAATALGLSVSAWAAGVPIAAHVFGRVTPGGLLANLVLMPAANVCVLGGALGALSSYASESAAAYLNNLTAVFTSSMVGVSAVVATLPGASFAVAPWSVGACIAWYGLCLTLPFCAWWLRRRRLA